MYEVPPGQEIEATLVDSYQPDMFTGVMTRPEEVFKNSRNRVGWGREVLDLITGRVGSGRVGSGRVRSSRLPGIPRVLRPIFRWYLYLLRLWDCSSVEF